MIHVLSFGRLGELADSDHKEVRLSPTVSDITGLANYINSTEPALGEALFQPRVMVAVNQTLVGWDAVLGEGDEVAFLPPVTGG